MPGDAVLGAQALEERKIVLPVLSAILARRAGADMEGKGIRSLNAMALEHLGDDLRQA